MSVKSYSADRLGEVPPLRNRGPWAAGTYPAGSIVTYLGYTYMSVVKTSATPQLPTPDYTQAFPTLPANDSAPWSYTGTPFPTVGATSLFTGTTGLGGATSCLIIAGANQGGSSHYAELTKTFVSAGTITFADACSSEGGWDHGRFFIDGVQQRDITGAIPWAANSYSVAAGSHTFKWLYVKDGSGDAGLDAYAVTNIVLAGTGTGATVPWVAIGLDAETVRDTIAATLVQSNGIIITSNDALDTITIGQVGYPAAVLSKTAAYTAVAGDLIRGDATSAGFTITLPSNPTVGSCVSVQKIDASVNLITVAASGSGTIHGDATATISERWAGAVFEHLGSDVWQIQSMMGTGNSVLVGGAGILAALYNTNAGGISNTSTSSVDVSAANLAVTFTVPPSGSVLVTLTASCQQQTSGAQRWGLRSGSSDVAGSFGDVTNYAASSGNVMAMTHRAVISGLTPGASLTYKWAWLTTSGTSWLYVGASSGGAPATMTVEAIAPTVAGVLVDESQLAPVTPNDQTGTSYTFVLADRSRVVTGSNASAQAYTIPPNSSVAYPLGTSLQLEQKGAGQITWTAGAGVTLRIPRGAKTAIQYGMSQATQVALNEWVVSGDVMA